MKRVVVSVTNDLSTDQRVSKVCTSLVKMGFEVCLVGRKLAGSLPLNRSYETHRMRLMFIRGPLFYAEYNFRLFFFLLFRKTDLLVSNDLDTLLPNFLVHRLKGVALVYDSHEFYTETPELVNRPRVQRIWERIEGMIFPKLHDVFTVNESIARLYSEKYGITPKVVRNIPATFASDEPKSRAALGLPPDKYIVLMQGAGINIQRGAEEAIEAIQLVDDAVLLIIGAGDVIGQLKQQAASPALVDKVIFLPKMPYPELMQHTRAADIGLTLDKDTNINYRYSLPNKLFDYIHAGIPVLASRLPEVSRIVEGYDIGLVTDSHQPEILAGLINTMLHDEASRSRWKDNLRTAARELNWENEENVLKSVYQKYV
ncbi:MAG: glycosyltransferase [Bacteroidales bacterium]|nr:glycosyltransferase [Bacteroidales bacterium]